MSNFIVGFKEGVRESLRMAIEICDLKLLGTLLGFMIPCILLAALGTLILYLLFGRE